MPHDDELLDTPHAGGFDARQVHFAFPVRGGWFATCSTRPNQCRRFPSNGECRSAISSPRVPRTPNGHPGWRSSPELTWRVAQALPQPSCAYVKLPWPHLYEYPASIASITIERVFMNENAVFVVPIKNPAKLTVLEVNKRIREFQKSPSPSAIPSGGFARSRFP